MTLEKPSCPGCGWSVIKCNWPGLLQKRRCSCGGRVKLYCAEEYRSDVIFKARPNIPQQNEALINRFIKKYTTIPVPKIFNEFNSVDDKKHILIMAEIRGQTLEQAWPTLSTADKNHIADQVAEYLAQLRNLRSKTMEALNNGPLYSAWLFLQGTHTPHGPFESDAQLSCSIERAISDIPEKARAKFMNRLPPSAPYTFTHGDLIARNIMVDNGQLTGILDWEGAGYFPVWWEYVSLTIGLWEKDAEWKKLLRDRLCPFPEAKDFWHDFYSLHLYPELDKRGQEVLNGLQGEDSED